MSLVVVILVLVGILIVLGMSVRLRQLRGALDVMQTDLRRALARLEHQDEAASIMRRALNRPPVPAVVPKPVLTLVKDGRDLVKDHPKTVALSTTLAALAIAIVTANQVAQPPQPPMALPAPRTTIQPRTTTPTVPTPGPVVAAEPRTANSVSDIPVRFNPPQRTTEGPVIPRPAPGAPAPIGDTGGSTKQPPPPVVSDPPTSGPSPTPTPTPDPPTTSPSPQPLLCVSALGVLSLCL